MHFFNRDLAGYETLVQNTYITAIIFMVVAFFIALLIASMIKWQGHPDTSFRTRRIFWIIIGIVIPLVFWILNSVLIDPVLTVADLKPLIKSKDAAEKFIGAFGWHKNIATLVCCAGYFLLSVITMMIFRSSKWGSILGESKNKN